MELEAILHTRHTGQPLYGMDPALDLYSHARAALQMHMRWTTNTQGGRTLRTKTGHIRVVPRNTRRLARAYVEEAIQPTAFPSMDDCRLAKRAYAASLEVELENFAEELLNLLWHANIAQRGKALTYIGSLQRLGLLRSRHEGEA